MSASIDIVGCTVSVRRVSGGSKFKKKCRVPTMFVNTHVHLYTARVFITCSQYAVNMPPRYCAISPSLLISSVRLWHISAPPPPPPSSGRPPLVYTDPVVAVAALPLVRWRWWKKLLISGLGLTEPISGRPLARRGRVNGPRHRPVIYR